MAQPSRERLEKALRNAHNAGDTAAAKRFAGEIRKLDAAPQPRQAAQGGNPNLRTYRVPERMFGMNMPYSGGETEIASNESSGFQIEIPKRASDDVKEAIARGVQAGESEKQRYADLAIKGATSLATNKFGLPTSGVVGFVGNRSGGNRNKTLERFGAATYGAEDIGTLGFSDELSGVIHGDEAKTAQREGIKNALKEHPLSFAAGGIPAVAAPFQSIQGASTAARIGSGFLRAGIPGAIYGYGSGEGGPLSIDRLWKAGQQGLLAGGIGSAAEPVGVLGSKVLRSIPGNHALRAALGRIMSGSDVSSDDLQLLEEAITQTQTLARSDGRGINRAAAREELMAAAQNMEANDFLGEGFGGAGVNAMQGNAKPGMGGGTELTEKVSTRAQQQYQRINDTVTELTGGNDINSGLRALEEYRTQQANPMYREAYKVPVNVNDPLFQRAERFYQQPRFQRGLARGQDIMRLRTGNPNADIMQMPYFERVQYIKEGLDDQIGAALRSGDNNLASALTQSKNEWLGIIDQMNPTYGQARQMWAGQAAMKNALTMGEQVMNMAGSAKSGQALRDIQEAYSRMGEAEQIGFQIGLFDRIMAGVGDVQETATANSAKAKFLTPRTSEVIRGFMPEEQADAFLGMIEREYRQQMNANQILPRSGPGTASDIAAQDSVRGATGGFRGLLGRSADPRAMIGRQQARLQRWLENNPGRQEQLARFLGIQEGSAEYDQLLRALGMTPPTGPGSPLPQAGRLLPPPHSPTGGGSPPSGSASSQAAIEASQAAPVAQNGFIRPEMLNNPTTIGAIGGGMAGGTMAQDLDGDGRVSWGERYAQGTVGALAGGFGGRAIGRLDKRMISKGSRQVLEGGNPPSEAGFSKPGRTSDTIYAKSGRKYSMAEGSTMSKVIELARQGKSNTQIDEALGLSPGVAAHYRNVAKTGKPPVDLSPQALPMDEASRMARAREMGFDTDNVSYRGINGDYDPSKAGNYQMFTRSPEDAGEYGNYVIPAYLKRGRNLEVNGGGNNFNSVPVSQLPDDVRANLHPSTGSVARTDEIAYAAQKAGYDSVSINNVYDNASGEIPRKPAPRSSYDDQEIHQLLSDLGVSSADEFGPVTVAPEIPRNYDPTTVDIVFDPKNIRSKYATFDPSQSESPVLTAGIGGRRRKDMLKDVMPESQGARVPGTQRPQPKPPVQPRQRRLPRMPELDMYELRPQIMSGLTAGGLGGGGLYIAYSQYKAEQERRNQPSMDYEAFVAAIQQEMRREKGLPPTPSLKPRAALEELILSN